MPTIRIITTNPIVPVRSSPSDSEFHITIDRFGQEEDATGASFTEPIDLETTDWTSRQMSRSLGKQSHSAAAARLSNPSTKFDRQPKIAVKRSYKFGRCTAHRITAWSRRIIMTLCRFIAASRCWPSIDPIQDALLV